MQGWSPPPNQRLMGAEGIWVWDAGDTGALLTQPLQGQVISGTEAELISRGGHWKPRLNWCALPKLNIRLPSSFYNDFRWGCNMYQ